jgi:hypothetical protein
MEAWNTRIRRISDDERNPFDHWKDFDGWKEKNKPGIKKWVKILKKKVDEGKQGCVLLAGSDAHGSFNYSTALFPPDKDLRSANDNCLGRVRTLLYLPERNSNRVRRAPHKNEIVKAIRTGSCVVTDGPVVDFTMNLDDSKPVTLGQTLTVRGGDKLNVKVRQCSTDEFGQVKSVRIFYYFENMEEEDSKPLDFQVNGTAEVVNDNKPVSGSGYVRLTAKTKNGQKDTFRCLTNPIWVKSTDNVERHITIECVEWDDINPH